MPTILAAFYAMRYATACAAINVKSHALHRNRLVRHLVRHPVLLRALRRNRLRVRLLVLRLSRLVRHARLLVLRRHATAARQN